MASRSSGFGVRPPEYYSEVLDPASPYAIPPRVDCITRRTSILGKRTFTRANRHLVRQMEQDGLVGQRFLSHAFENHPGAVTTLREYEELLAEMRKRKTASFLPAFGATDSSTSRAVVPKVEVPKAAEDPIRDKKRRGSVG